MVWGLKLPSVIFSVTGSAQFNHLDPRIEDYFKQGLAVAAGSAEAWVLSGGSSTGVMELVGKALMPHHGVRYTATSLFIPCAARAFELLPSPPILLSSISTFTFFSLLSFLRETIPSTLYLPTRPLSPLTPEQNHMVFSHSGYLNSNLACAYRPSSALVPT